MAVKCPVCQSENQDDDLKCVHCGEDLMMSGTRYEKPLKMLREMGQKVVDSSGTLSKEKLEGVYFHIVEQLQDIMDNSREELDSNLEKLRKEMAKASDINEEDIDLKSFVEGFHSAQSIVNEGIGMALGALMNMRSFKDLKEGQTQLDLAITHVQEGLEHLERLSIGSAGLPLTEEGEEPVPMEVVSSMDSIEKALESINSFMIDRHDIHISTALARLDEARSALSKFVELRREEAATEAATEAAEAE